TLQRVHRSQYIALWSRLGTYNPEHLDDLLSGHSESACGRRLFEYWRHAACLIPLAEYRYSLPLARQYQTGKDGWKRHWINQPGNRRLVENILQQVRSSGPVRSADFESTSPRRSSWWDWKPAKIALEHLYNRGDLMVSDRVNFQRVYDLTERVLPPWVDLHEPTESEASSYLLERSMKALGICDPRQVPDYMGLKRTKAKPLIEQMIGDGTFTTITARLDSDNVRELVVHRDDLPRLERAADGSLVPNHVTFLSPFDNLFWAKRRAMQFWGFEQILEAYKPQTMRRWGYFCMPILYHDQLVGRIDPKLDRLNKTLRLVNIYLEPGVQPHDKLVASLADALRDFMAFHDARDLVIERSLPTDLGTMVLRVI
ncbi:winged helix DNA-binding domain-containing protein, partial [Dehalococcoidia bacterium]|nr:winged helix DNA-binding domain-containing protein [Dehalococcoidia bacterium]